MNLHQIRQSVNTNHLPDPYQDARQSLLTTDVLKPVKPGQRVCIGLPSRGIGCLADVTRACVDALLAISAEVFIVPAMGSHGGGTAQGQQEVLASYGIDEEHLGVPILSSMEAVCVGSAALPGSSRPMPIFWDANALTADHVLVINRIKEHTAFSGPVESGLTKILSVGLGKAIGAESIHSFGLAQAMPAAGNFILSHLPVLGGVAIVENGLHQPAIIEAIPAASIPQREPELLEIARGLLPHIPCRALDVLVVCWMGKDLSGTGLDTNIIGKYRRNWGNPVPNYQRIVVLDLTDASHGNATGVGFADVITRRLADKIDLEATILNCVTAGNFNGAKLPIVRATDREAIDLALSGFDPANVRLAVIESTLSLESLWISDACLVDESELKSLTTGVNQPFVKCFNVDGAFTLP